MQAILLILKEKCRFAIKIRRKNLVIEYYFCNFAWQIVEIINVNSKY